LRQGTLEGYKMFRGRDAAFASWAEILHMIYILRKFESIENLLMLSVWT
jgi:hypothetical protein